MRHAARLHHLVVASVLAATLAPAPARGGEFEVSPILVEVDAGRRSALLTVKNVSSAQTRYEVRAFAWKQDINGKVELAPTSDVVVFPPLLDLAPGAERNVRLGLTGAPAPLEKTYRVFVEELPPPEKTTASGQVRVLTRIGIPVFFAPVKTERRAELAILSAGGGRVTFTVRNKGTVRIRPTAVRLTGTNAAGESTFEIPLDPWYVLANGERAYEVTIPAEACRRTRVVRATAAVEPAPLEASLLLPQGACAQ